MADETRRARIVGFNHIALEVGTIDEALEFYGRIFDFELRAHSETMAFIELGDQFIALSAGREQEPDAERHFGLVVDDMKLVRERLEAVPEAEILESRGLDFRDPWGNRFQIVQYDEIQFLKDPGVLSFLGLGELDKNESARQELREKGISPPGE